MTEEEAPSPQDTERRPNADTRQSDPENSSDKEEPRTLKEPPAEEAPPAQEMPRDLEAPPAQEENQRPEFEISEPPKEFQATQRSSELEPVKYEIRSNDFSRHRTASRQIALSKRSKTADKLHEVGQTPVEITTIPASSVTRKRIQ